MNPIACLSGTQNAEPQFAKDMNLFMLVKNQVVGAGADSKVILLVFRDTLAVMNRVLHAQLSNATKQNIIERSL